MDNPDSSVLRPMRNHPWLGKSRRLLSNSRGLQSGRGEAPGVPVHVHDQQCGPESLFNIWNGSGLRLGQLGCDLSTLPRAKSKKTTSGGPYAVERSNCIVQGRFWGSLFNSQNRSASILKAGNLSADCLDHRCPALTLWHRYKSSVKAWSSVWQ